MECGEIISAVKKIAVVMANECGYLPELDARNGDGDLGLTMENRLNLVMEKAGSGPGEKTILDAVMPAVKILKEGIQQEKIWQLAAEAAEEGMQSTGSMRPVHGRAAYYGEKSIGMVDGGAVAGMLIFRTIAEWKGEETVDAG